MTLLEKAKKATKKFIKENKFDKIVSKIEEKKKVNNKKEVKVEMKYSKDLSGKALAATKIIYPENGELPFGCNTGIVRSLASSLLSEEIVSPEFYKGNKEHKEHKEHEEIEEIGLEVKFNKYQVFYHFYSRKFMMFLGSGHPCYMDFFILDNHKIFTNDDDNFAHSVIYIDEPLPFRPATDTEIEKFIAKFTE